MPGFASVGLRSCPEQLARHLAWADYGAIRVVRAPVDGEHVLHLHRQTPGARLQRNDPLLVQMRLQLVWDLSVRSLRRTVSWLRGSTTLSSTILSARRRRLHRTSGLGFYVRSFPQGRARKSGAGCFGLFLRKARRPPRFEHRSRPALQVLRWLSAEPGHAAVRGLDVSLANPFEKTISPLLRKFDVVYFLRHEIEAFVSRSGLGIQKSAPQHSHVTKH